MKRHKKRKRIKKGIAVFFIILFFILVLGYILLFSPLFKIKTVEVSGNKEVRTETIKENFNYGNVFLLTNKKIKTDLLNNFPKISEVDIKKNLIKRIIFLTIEERERLGIICRMNLIEEEKEESIKGCFYFDKNGFIFDEALETSGSLILLVKDYSQKEINLGEQLFDGGVANFISQVKENLSSETNIEIKDIILSSFPYAELKVLTSEGWFIIFNLQRDLKGQILSLKAALNEKIPEERREKLEYIDLRTENRVYYK